MQPAEVLLLVADALDALEIPYCIGGSFASATYGEPRATRDVDILVALPASKAAPLVAQIEPEFFLQLTDLRDAVALAPTLRDNPLHRATCNAIHRGTFFRVDLFISSGRAYERAQLSRRIRQTVTLNPERQAFFVSPEDIILAKLEWYRMAEGMLDRQWSDVQSVIATQQSTLDLAYLNAWALTLAIPDLLAAALRGEAPPNPAPPRGAPDQLRLDM
jgi:hypothetical protein